MAPHRKRLVLTLLGGFVLLHLPPIVLHREYWPLSHYSMYSGIRTSEVKKWELWGLTTSGEEIRLIPSKGEDAFLDQGLDDTILLRPLFLIYEELPELYEQRLEALMRHYNGPHELRNVELRYMIYDGRTYGADFHQTD